MLFEEDRGVCFYLDIRQVLAQHSSHFLFSSNQKARLFSAKTEAAMQRREGIVR